jgi:hypothetical protein
VPSYWCGDETSLAYVLDHFDELIVKPAFYDRRGDRTPATLMDRAVRQGLIQRIRARPQDFVAEHWPELSGLPHWKNGKLESARSRYAAFCAVTATGTRSCPAGSLASTPRLTASFCRSARAAQQGRLGARAPPAARFGPAGDARSARRAATRRLDPAEPPARRHLLARTLRRALRRDRSRDPRRLRAHGLEAGPDAPRAMAAIFAALREFGRSAAVPLAESAQKPRTPTRSNTC